MIACPAFSRPAFSRPKRRRWMCHLSEASNNNSHTTITETFRALNGRFMPCTDRFWSLITQASIPRGSGGPDPANIWLWGSYVARTPQQKFNLNKYNISKTDTRERLCKHIKRSKSQVVGSSPGIPPGERPIRPIPVRTARTYRPCLRPVCTAAFLTPVRYTGPKDDPYVRAVRTGRTYG